ncbi:hypothetical protein K7X08_035695 [Anisodus acutangulus]|uniref:Uncharacterized protein n=1 Tax=Anisodus acutangulus TaxID=402998 RepID=A0A9Q1R6I6_9SOLA|nr:hypothetical protein K7X08_035695 [Anisodus acutangulus]
MSPRDRRSDKDGKDGAATVDYIKLIQGYENMTLAGRVRAKMKLQLSESARKDERKGTGWEHFDFDRDAPLDDEEIEARKDERQGMGSGWERFDFDKDTPLDDEEIEERKVPLFADTDTLLTASTVEDDGALVNHIGKSFRFSAVEEEQIKAAHDEAIFGSPSLLPLPPSIETDDEAEEDHGKKDLSKVAPATSLISGHVIS